MHRQSAPTNATPGPLARLDECPYRDAHLRSAARHCHPPITRPSFMSRLERIRTLPVVYGGNRAGLLASWARVFPFVCELRHIALPRIDLPCVFSQNCHPSPMAGSFLRRGPPPHRRTHPCAGADRPAHDSRRIPDSPAAFLESAGGDLKERNRQLANRGARRIAIY
jgi:hypothetical protein